MKKKKPDFDAAFWAGRAGSGPVQLFDAFFSTYPLSGAKEHLSSMMRYVVKTKVLSEKDPSVVFHFYLSLRSVIRAADHLSHTSGKIQVQSSQRTSVPTETGKFTGGGICRPVPGLPEGV